jgi:hypothetical protein
MARGLASGTEITGRYIPLYKRAHAREIIVAHEQLQGFGFTIVASKRIVVMRLHQLNA